jgi:hypothetical protein
MRPKTGRVLSCLALASGSTGRWRVRAAATGKSMALKRRMFPPSASARTLRLSSNNRALQVGFQLTDEKTGMVNRLMVPDGSSTFITRSWPELYCPDVISTVPTNPSPSFSTSNVIGNHELCGISPSYPGNMSNRTAAPAPLLPRTNAASTATQKHLGNSLAR